MAVRVLRRDVPRGALRPPVAWPVIAALAAGVALLLLSVAHRYGYSRDELYFLRAGTEPAPGYADNPPLTPLLAAAVDALFPGSLVALRVPAALMAAGVVLLTGVLARELGGGRAAQGLAAACMAVSVIVAAVGHLLSTTTADLLAWTALSWLLVRALRDGGPVWLLAGVVAGVALQNKWQPAFLVGAVLLGVLVVGPRPALRSRWPWLGGVLALVIWAPNLAWQAAAGWPQLELSRAIASGSSGTSEPWYLFLPYQLVMISPVLVPVWVAGWWRLARDPALRSARAFAPAYVLLALLFVATGGKPYYLTGLYPILLAAGAEPALDWACRGRARLRRALLGAALAVSLAVSAFLFLPLVPVDRLAGTPVPDVNYDAGETVGWPELAATVREVRAGLPEDERVAVLAQNYGQAGAVDRFAPELGPAASGHNAYWDWGPPPEDATTIIVIGFSEERLQDWFEEVVPAARVDNGVGLDNDEQGTPVWVVRFPVRPWPQLWPDLRRLG